MTTIDLDADTGTDANSLRQLLRARREFLHLGNALVARCRHEQVPVTVALVCASPSGGIGGGCGAELCRLAMERLASYVGRNCLVGNIAEGHYALLMPGTDEVQAERIFVSLLDTIIASLSRSSGGRWEAPGYAVEDLCFAPGPLEHALAHLGGQLALGNVEASDATCDSATFGVVDFSPTVAMPLSRC